MHSLSRFTRAVAVAALLLVAASAQAALPRLLIITAGLVAPDTEMLATGLFSTVDVFDATSGTPPLATLLAHDTILAITNSQPLDGVALGNALGGAADNGRRVVVATYSLSQPWWISGKMQTHGYSPLVNVNVNGDVSGNLVAINPSDPIFGGVNLATLTYFHNNNFAHPTLDVGATLLATDGAGIDMIARSANGRIVALNLFPEGGGSGGNVDLYRLVANSLVVGAGAVSTAIPTLSEWGLMLLIAALAIGGWATVRRRAG
jgi:hypothetical protein